MSPVDTMAFITHAWTRQRIEALRRCVRAGLMLSVGCLMAGWALAREPVALLSEVHHDADGIALSVRLDTISTPVVQDALLKGVPLFFVWQAELTRSRWYWTDKTVATVSRTYRLAYQPLTRRWRLSLASDGQAGPGGAGLMFPLHQSYDSLEDALAIIGRVSYWRVAPASRIDADDRHRLQWRFQLDLRLLPRPFQIGMGNQPDWNIDIAQRLDVPKRIEAVPPEEGRDLLLLPDEER